MNNGNGQQPLFYEDIMDALNKMININPKGLTIKQIAMELWPSRNPDTARSVLSRAMNPEHHDHNLSPEELLQTMKITDAPEHIINFLCDEFGFERPPKKERGHFERTVKEGVKSIQEQLKQLTREIARMEKMSNEK
jgi:hypothetical protein